MLKEKKTLVKLSHEQMILRLMARKQGATNGELNNIEFRYGARIHKLRKDGHLIITVFGRGTLVTYYLRDKEIL